MNLGRLRILFLSGAVLLADGCASDSSPATRPDVASELATTLPAYWLATSGPSAAHTDFEKLWAAAEQAAREHGFALDRTDYRAGLLTTEPLVSKQFFEFWRKDVTTAAGVAESSLATIRRTVRFEFDPQEVGSYRVTPKVLVERFNMSERRITSTHQYRRLVNPHNPAQLGSGAYWYPIGRDHNLERRLVEAIQQDFTR